LLSRMTERLAHNRQIFRLRALSNRPQSTLHTLWLRSPQGGCEQQQQRSHQVARVTPVLQVTPPDGQAFRSSNQRSQRDPPHRACSAPYTPPQSGSSPLSQRPALRLPQGGQRCRVPVTFAGSRTTQRRLPSSPQGGAAFIAPPASTGHR
jgi:hypothetical protein